MRKILYAFFCVALLFTARANAQCLSGRYIDTTFFPTITKSTVTYSIPYNLKMDIFQPAGDLEVKRPLIILAHGGAFYSGNKSTDITITRLCSLFAHRGYVTASIDYRLVPNALAMGDSATAINEVIKALSDGKAAVRYFLLDRMGANLYRIDTNRIFAGGNSAGAVLYMHLGYIQSTAECPPYIVNAMNLNGGFEGDSGNPIPGYTTHISAVINLAGALNMSSFINVHDTGSVNAQGDQDATVPYNCGHALGGACPVTLCGMGVLEGIMTSQQVYHQTVVFPGQGHVPWSNNNTNNSMFYTVDSLITRFLADGYVCSLLSVAGVKRTMAELTLFPNPTRDVINLKSSEAINSLSIYDATGRLVQQYDVNGRNTISYQVNTTNIPAGIYFVRAKFVHDDEYAPVVKQIVVE